MRLFKVFFNNLKNYILCIIYKYLAKYKMDINLHLGFYNNGKPFSPETYLKKYAKITVRNWFHDETDVEYTHSFININEGKCFRPNRECGIWVDYPIVIDNKYNSVNTNWDELDYDPNAEGRWTDAVPTIEQCKILNVKILKLMDVVVSHKGVPALFIHIYDKKRMSNYEINELRKCKITNLIEINVRWIMSQTKKPDILEYFQIIP